MPTLELSAGPIDYRDSGGDGLVVVLLHGVLMDSGQWREVERRLGSDLRLVLPTLPLGGHRRPMRPDADLSLLGQARPVAELLEALDLRDVTLGFNDWAAPQLLVAERLTGRVAGMILSQLIDSSEVADRLTELVDAGPSGRVPDIGGPEILSLRDVARLQREILNRRLIVMELPLPGKTARAFARGDNLCPEQAVGRISYADYLEWAEATGTV
jgi:pimeloyl-ACP methyl ester carboxylesterase